MKKLIPVLIVLLSLAMTGCLVEDNSAEIVELKKEIETLKAGKIEQTEEADSGLFKKNLECFEKKNDAVSEISTWSSSLGAPGLEAIFYSSKENECLVLLNRNHGDIPYSDKALYRLSELTHSGHPIEGCMEEGFRACNKFAEEILEEYKK